ncbi:MAG: hypothetical protein LLF95_05765 [Bacteroidales bacterium]|nr:hypothetical protein [Bacteroidales bacterium]
MTGKFQNKYRIPSARWQSWDYSSEGLYFITINGANHACLFSTITDKELYLSEYGRIADDEWNKSFEIRQDGAYVNSNIANWNEDRYYK